MTIRHAVFLLCVPLLLSGCATAPSPSSFPAAANRDSVLAAWGKPALVRSTASGERWIYTTAMEGRETWFVDFDRSGAAKETTQVLTNERVLSLKVGMSMSEVEDLIGPKYYELRYTFKRDEPVHIYRFLRSEREAVCLYVHYGLDNRVNQVAYAPDALRVITLQRACQT